MSMMQLYTLSPYRPGRVPVVLVHGTASSPARWADLVNELDSDPRIGPRCQFWLFTYNTGNPLLYSAGLLREALEQAVAELDPPGADAALHRMVLIGHSQGGLLVKLAVVDSGTRFWDNVSTTPVEALDVSAEARAILHRSMFFTPLPFVRRAVFVATPHRGSDVAGFVATRLRRLLTWALTLPANLLQATGDVLAASEDPLLRRTLGQGLPRSVDNMSPGNRAIRTLSALPVAPGVTVHSIIAVRGDGPPETGATEWSATGAPIWTRRCPSGSCGPATRCSHPRTPSRRSVGSSSSTSMAGKAVARPRGLTVIAILALVQGVSGIALALAFIGRGIELLMRSRPILGLLGLAVGALVAIGPALHLVFAWGALSLRSWAWWVGSSRGR